MGNLVYFDHAAATPVDPRVFEAMKPYFTEQYGNPSSIYRFAQNARRAVEAAREKTAGILNCAPREIIFTSCGTESNNLFIHGVAQANKNRGQHIVTTKIEHDSVLRPLEFLAKNGFEVTYLDVGENGAVKPQDVASALRPDTIFVTIMYANNEIGTIQPIAEIAREIENFRMRAKTSGASNTASGAPFFHTDACQAAPYLDLSIKKLNVDAMTLNGGKIYGPKGAGVLFLKENVALQPLLLGGGQEYRKRSGTENVPAIVGFAAALELVQKSRGFESARLIPLRDKLMNGILKNIPDTRLNGDPNLRLPNSVNVSFKGLEGEAVLMRLDMLNIAASSGSACASGALEPSHVLRALGLSDEWTHSGTRFSLGHGNTEAEIDFVLKELPPVIKDLREISPF